MLADPDSLDRFLDAIFRNTPLPISVKTRVGMTDEQEFPQLLDILNQYPIRELTVHPRVRKDFYKTPIRKDAFLYALEHSANPLCYNGDVCSTADIALIAENCPQIRSVMIGRGLIGDPGMLVPGGTTASAMEAFHNDLLEQYTITFNSARNAMFRLKENWRHMSCRFDGGHKLFKRLRKTTDLQEFRSITTEIFRTLPLASRLTPDWTVYD